MTKQRKSSSSKSKKSRKGSSGNRLSGLLVLLLILAGLFIADQLGIVDIEWKEIFSEMEQPEPTAVVFVTPSPGAPATTVPVTSQAVAGWYQLYFTSPQYPDAPETRNDGVMQALIGVINSAQRNLDIAIYELNLDPIGDAILAAQNRGVKVRMVTDTDELEELETLIRLEEEGIPMAADERSAIMHNKFVVVDGQAVWTGSWNFTVNDTFRNNNNAIYIKSPEMAADYTAEFEEMFIDQAFGPSKRAATTPYPQVQIGDTRIEVCFAPEDECGTKLAQVINGAQQAIRFMAFSFTHDEVGRAVEERGQAGVTVQGVFETRGSETNHSEFERMKQLNFDVWQDGNPYTLHHKVFIIDDKIVVMGSFNFSSNADESNDENMLIIHNAGIAGQFMAEFNQVYSQAQQPQE